MTGFTPISATIGGVLIGLAASSLLLVSGRIAGISGILGGLLGGRDAQNDRAWYALFLGGLVAGGAVALLAVPGAIDPSSDRPLPVVIFAGLLVGYGTRLGGGCTSGHGVCGLARGSTRSIVATGVFMAMGGLAAYATRVALQGGS